MAGKIYEPRRTDGLWRGVMISGVIFIAMATGLSITCLYRASLLASFPPDTYLVEGDFIPGHEGELWATVLLSFGLVLSYIVGAIIVLCWYVRSIRNAQVLHRGIETTPGWAVWNFIVPIISLFRPYTMTSELWRSSQKPEGWKSLHDPASLRWWWGLILVGGFISIVANVFSGSADSTGTLRPIALILACMFATQAVAGILFLRLGRQISKRQTALVLSGHRPSAPTIPAWSA